MILRKMLSAIMARACYREDGLEGRIGRPGGGINGRQRLVVLKLPAIIWGFALLVWGIKLPNLWLLSSGVAFLALGFFFFTLDFPTVAIAARMIPAFDANGNLPPGVHPATLGEVEARFGTESELRRVQMQSLR
jgi:hypothetical protein